MVTPFSTFTGSNKSLLTDALLAPNSGISINTNSIILDASGQDAVNFYNGSLAPLDIGSGLLLTSGTTPGITNTVGWFGTDNSFSSGFNNGDADINAVVNTVFNTLSYDATSLAFNFTANDLTATSISFNIVFGSDEYPEWVDQFVDSAVVMVNGVNYALFNHDPNHPLSVVSSNLAAGYFQNNSTNVLPIEYDGVSHMLKIVAPINPGGATNQIKIAIADTGDHVYDSGIFIANLSAGNIPGSGVVSVTPPGSTTDNSDTVTGSAQDEYIDLKGGNDVAYAGAGDDIIVAGAGNDSVYGGSGEDQIKGDAGNDLLDGGDGVADTAVFSGISTEYNIAYTAVNNSYTITDSKIGSTSEGNDTLLNTELVKFSDGLFALNPSGLTTVSNPAVPPANTPGSVIISGIGSLGNVLTATVGDPDGVSGAVNYQWQISGNGGASWSNIGTNSNSYTVSATDVGNSIQVVASYTDNGAVAESPSSAPKAILETNNGNLVVTLMQLTAPPGTSTINPLTTLLKNAIDLGLSPNLATLSLQNVLAIPGDINIQNYDAYAKLVTNPTNPTALEVETISVQIAILTSLSDDDTGLNLTSAIIEAAANNQTLDLANANDLASILGVDITGITDKADYPQPLREIFDRNNSMADAIADGDDVSAIEQEWQDLLSIQDGINSTSIADLSIDVNQAPTGIATATLPQGVAGSSYIINPANLLTGFTDSDGDVLSVTDLATSVSGGLTNNANGTWTFTPNANYSGPVELTYTVIDGQGGSISGNQLFVIAPNQVIQVFTGTANADNLIGSPMADTLIGLAGNDIYTVNNIGDTVVEALNAGTDTVKASVSHTLANNTENLTLLGTTNLDGTGNSLNNSLIGNTGNNILIGGDGNDIIDGKAGVDNMEGGLGNDIYTIDNVADVVIEALNAGTDTVKAPVSYTLANNTESLTLLGTTNLDGTGNNLNNSLIGNTGNNILIGGDGNDIIDGNAGVDNMEGGLGNDTYTIDNVADVVIEALNAGTDTVKAPVSYTLANNTENLTLLGTTNLDGTGTSLKNSLIGNTGNNILIGGGGTDILTGNAGSDIIVGNLENDTINLGLGDGAVDIVRYAFGDGTDTVNQFVKGIDKLALTGNNFLIDIVTTASDTQFRLGNGAAAGYGTGNLLMTLKGVTGLTATELGAGGTSLDVLNTAQFFFN
jgi:Ca2+-binding RTX toxin-like protein